ncbi:enoyl-CoA hydratase/isomerase family protein [Peptoniphilus raoultii]|uniref:enoyl-CoA hydratase/isomerase family protein n=1 Tax=Peptoniphilus raoultii TaxID=1776387 RepID=UPI0008D8FD57|nr:enoyl-CoA hydratase/isomerase family protein [Peptoniphilus raoultii]
MIIKEINNNVGLIFLNRPKNINALNLQMISDLKNVFEEWENNDEVKIILLDGLGDKGFCAGGDLKNTYYDFVNNDECEDKLKLFKEEFALHKYVKNYKKKIICNYFGVVMGGGIGLSINNDFKICSGKVKWAMPEIKLGFVPDAGVGHFLSRLPHPIGLYLSLTGESIEASDLIRLGLADLYIDPKDYENLQNLLFKIARENDEDKILEVFKNESKDFAKDLEDTRLSKNMEKIEKYFSHKNFKAIFEGLKENFDDSFAYNYYKALKSYSPFMVLLQFEKYFAEKKWSFEESLNKDLAVLDYAIKSGRIKEGIRASMIDKDNKPLWPLKSFDQVKKYEILKILESNEFNI